MSINNYEVGYGKPPKSGQFKPGQSGNSKGRPKKPKNKVPTIKGVDILAQRTNQIVLEEAYREVSVRSEDGKIEKMPVFQAVLRSMGLNGIKGNRMAGGHFVGIAQNVEDAQREQKAEVVKEAVEYKVTCEKEDREAAENSRPAPLHFPHPDDMVIDAATGLVSVVGPLTKEDNSKMLDTLKQRDAMLDEIEIIRGELATATSDAEIEESQKYLKSSTRILKILNLGLPPRLQISLEEFDFAQFKNAVASHTDVSE